MSVDWDWTRVVFDHVKIVVRDAEASIGFYKTVLEPLGIPPLWESDRGAQFANLVVYADDRPSGPVHMAFVADIGLFEYPRRVRLLWPNLST